jgi:3-dehydroquinate synthase
MAGPVRTVTVRTRDAHYDIIIGSGALAEAAGRREVLSRDRIALVASERVYALHRDYIEAAFSGLPGRDLFLMRDGEENKNYRGAEPFLDGMLAKGHTRQSAVIGVGGGVVGDFSGFLAALYMRGIPVIHVPTTLLAMADSSIGGKTAVNISAGKNIIGAFHQPALVLSDTRFLATLPVGEYGNGLAEAVKHAFLGEKGLMDLFLANGPEDARREEVAGEIVYLSSRFKASVVERDEKEEGLRAILNFGHTVGHALESYMEYRGITHGEAVAVGMKAAIGISARLGLLPPDEERMMREILDRYGLVSPGRSFPADELLEHMRYDKKSAGGLIRFVLLKGAGHPVYNQAVEEKFIREALEQIGKSGG